VQAALMAWTALKDTALAIQNLTVPTAKFCLSAAVIAHTHATDK
jgi:hypothetical protein